ncbi:MAG: hypothetical protein IJJ45_02400 [Clostridia bacterium]|nr:hypothetical protein [Clostridia bacterium]
MKRTQVKDSLRNIWKQKVSYLSVIVIAFLGVATFLGISFSDAALRRNGSDMYNAVNYRDLEIMSTALLNEEDLEQIRDVEGVVDVEAVWQTGAKVSSGDKRQEINVITLTERVNQTHLIEGRLPEAADECAVEQRLAQDMGWKLGDPVKALTAKGEKAEYLKDGSFVIVGIADHPDHTSVSIPDTLYAMVLRDAFDAEALDGCFMKAEIVIDKPENIDRFSNGYEAAVGTVSERLERLASRRAQVRDGRGPGQGEVAAGRSVGQAERRLEQLQKARAELDEGWTTLADGESQIDQNEVKLADAKTQLQTSWAQLHEAKPKLDEAKAKLDKAKSDLSSGRKLLRSGRKQLDNARAELVTSWNKLEETKEKVRASVRATMGDVADLVDWATAKTVNIDDANATAMDFWITRSF